MAAAAVVVVAVERAYDADNDRSDSAGCHMPDHASSLRTQEPVGDSETAGGEGGCSTDRGSACRADSRPIDVWDLEEAGTRIVRRCQLALASS